ncbi:HesB/IscA family protein [Tanticharoenia sakaeratensis]|jgi:iron-sulfur cluster assembly protein|uniref:Iron-sulfur (Fe-S) cluster assembly protein HesB/YadR/YfhF n=1 Tax=Tanticharoenia sakaeratensis NBRC 103193 TaxID=1231623 RepID=A0A0D6MP51_9PROT|nr:iron-sulfur cluster assembly accessory protein [Tanticharoenia sakaeratensis]GAN55063.1 iron-sulfur (Fe-S) cluster assembly protein HesB/YadR/YfhF [Tanticharoenia sakaeratensis NBRC 103193]GBQ20107.1 iron-sulfur cluster assembly protein HesB/YadR/YfhF [Tanticharoenia sakaeratensis NBRC 103193]
MSTQTASVTPKRALPPLMSLSDRAASRLRALYAGAHEGQLLRISVSTRGCSGMSYDMNFVDAPADSDEIVRDHDLTVLVDRKATLFLIGTTMDYVTKDLESGFTFVNPNEKGRCGCGESFHV